MITQYWLTGAKIVADIINSIDRTQSAALMERIQQADGELHQKIKDLLFVFDDLMSIDDRGIQLLLRAMSKPAAAELRSRLLPLDVFYPSIARWIHRVEGLPGYERTYPPHWRESAAPATTAPVTGH